MVLKIYRLFVCCNLLVIIQFLDRSSRISAWVVSSSHCLFEYLIATIRLGTQASLALHIVSAIEERGLTFIHSDVGKLSKNTLQFLEVAATICCPVCVCVCVCASHLKGQCHSVNTKMNTNPSSGCVNSFLKKDLGRRLRSSCGM